MCLVEEVHPPNTQLHPCMQVATLSRTPLRVQNIRVNNVEIPNKKRIEISLQAIHGIGSTRAQKILATTVSNQPSICSPGLACLTW